VPYLWCVRLIGKPVELLVEAVGCWGEPLPSQDRPADLTERVLGYRAWRLDSRGLRSAAAQARWSRRTLVADCPPGGGQHVDHAAPVARCRCGIYALHEPEPRLLFRDELVWGAVALDGRVLLYGNGLRAERATILVLAYAGDEPQPGLVRAARGLDVELVPFSALIAAAGACGAAPAPDPQALGRGGPGDADGAWDALSPPSGPRPLAAAASLRG
jgi:hypothetical protein